jgi:hypothetical protein
LKWSNILSYLGLGIGIWRFRSTKSETCSHCIRNNLLFDHLFFFI